LLALHI